GPTTVTVTSSDGGVATVSADPMEAGGTQVTFPADSATGAFTVYGQGRSTGDTTLTVQAAGYSAGTAAGAVRPAGVGFTTGDFSTTSLAADTTLSVVPVVLDDALAPAIFGQAVRGGLTVSVPVTSEPETVGTIRGSPAMFKPSDVDNSATAFAPRGGGT